jgi:diacylglycerol O-acyltransferase
MAPDESLGVLDKAWLRMDRPNNLMMICGVMILAGPLALAEVRALVGARLLCFHRFRQRVAGHGAAARWETDPDFDLDWHVRRLALPAIDDGQLEALVGDLASSALDPARPMWQFHVIDGGPAGGALVLRVHHCYGDGFALMYAIGSLCDIDPRRPAPPLPDLMPQGPRRAAWERMLGPFSARLGDGVRLGQALLAGGAAWLAPAQALAGARHALALARQLAVIALMAPDAPTCLKGALGPSKRVAWAPPLSLFEVKAVAEAHACSVNDVLLGCVAGALARYLEGRAEPAPQGEIRALVPVNLRPPGPVAALGNEFGLVFLDLPTGQGDPVQRLRTVHKRMRALRRSGQATVALGILAAMGTVPDALKEATLEALAANASVVVSNVRGPPEARYFAGQRIARELFWVPQSGGIGVGISLLSYAGQVDVGVMTDARRVPDPGELARCFAREFDALLLAAMAGLPPVRAQVPRRRRTP